MQDWRRQVDNQQRGKEEENQREDDQDRQPAAGLLSPAPTSGPQQDRLNP